MGIEPEGLAPNQNLVALEHEQYKRQILNPEKPTYSSAFWQAPDNPSWSAYLQSKTKFRQSAPKITYARVQNEDGKMVWQQKTKDNTYINKAFPFKENSISTADNIQPLLTLDLETELTKLQTLYLEQSPETIAQQFARIDLYDNNDESKWQYHPQFGVYRKK